MARLMPFINICASMSTRTAFSLSAAGVGNSSAFCPTRLYFPFWYCMVSSKVWRSTSNVRGCSGISLSASSKVRAAMAKRPSASLSTTSNVVTMVVSLSDTVTVKTPSCNSKRKQSRMGSAFLELMTRLMPCKWAERAELETMKFIAISLFLVYFCVFERTKLYKICGIIVENQQNISFQRLLPRAKLFP